ncbi:hypothetical protein ElyMa_003487300 [Elysia marginata]|uniref:Uncharacterized protein n=1 Tax=Elysia marginata TaxID=1093978 RepID=A0AAV4EDA1_9GAST|nr:hypothetical protein ElyMa_003487300 [Elysia marginata]
MEPRAWKRQILSRSKEAFLKAKRTTNLSLSLSELLPAAVFTLIPTVNTRGEKTNPVGVFTRTLWSRVASVVATVRRHEVFRANDVVHLQQQQVYSVNMDFRCPTMPQQLYPDPKYDFFYMPHGPLSEEPGTCVLGL